MPLRDVSKISWESRLSQPPSSSNYNNCNAVIGVVRCRLFERCFPGESDVYENSIPAHFYDRMSGGCAVAYTIGVSTASGELVFVSKDMTPGGKAHPCLMLKDDVFPRLISGETVSVPDRPCYPTQHRDKIVTFPSPGKAVVVAPRTPSSIRGSRRGSRPTKPHPQWEVPVGLDDLIGFRDKLHEAMKMFYGFGCLHNEFRHGLEKQKMTFLATAFVVQVMLQNRGTAE